MDIDDTIRALGRIRQSIDRWAPREAVRPDVLIADLNDLYVGSTENRDFNELFVYDDVGSPSITLIVGIEVEFDLRRVVRNMRSKLHVRPLRRADEIENAGVVWSHGRYDFVYDRDSGSLRISHQYSHQRADTRSVSSIAKRMIDYALDYLEEVQASTRESAGPPEAG
jgi:hypothetical protein